MSHFAKIKDGVVVSIIVADQDWVDSLEGTWIQTSYNTHGNVHHGPDGEPDGGVPLRKNYAGIGSIYDSTADAFHELAPYESWNLNATTFFWEPPVEQPDDPVKEEGKDLSWHVWDEDAGNWVLTSNGD